MWRRQRCSSNAISARSCKPPGITASEPEAPLMLAIAFLQEAFAKGQPLRQYAERAIPTRCIPKRFRRYLYAQTGRGPRHVLVDRYEFWVYRLLR